MKFKFAFRRMSAFILAFLLCFSSFVSLLPVLTVTVTAEEEDSSAQTLQNVALGATVTATTSYIESFFNPAFLVDGTYECLPTLGWCTSTTEAPPADFYVTLTLKQSYTVSEIILKPMQWEKGKAFPHAYDLQVSEDGTAWTTVVTATGVSGGAASDTEVQPIVHTLDEPVNATYFRMKINEHGKVFDSGIPYSEIGEIELMGVPSASETDPEPVYGNIAKGQSITATSNYVPPEGFFNVTQLVDGIWAPYGQNGNNTIGWNSNPSDPIAEDTPIAITITLDKVYDIDEIILYPQMWGLGKCFPRNYDLQVSMNGKEWTTVASDMDVDASAAADAEVQPLTYTLDATVSAKYFRVYITRNSAQVDVGTGNYTSAMGEIELMGIPSVSEPETDAPETDAPETDPPTSDYPNIAVGQKAEATSNFLPPEGFFNITQLVDGIWAPYGQNGNNTIGWNSNPSDPIAEDTPIDITITLDKVYDIHEIILYPQMWGHGKSFPRDYDLQVSMDGREWTTVASDTGVDASAASDTEVQPIRYALDAPASAHYFRIHITRNSAEVDGGTGNYLSAIGELALYGTVGKEKPSMSIDRLFRRLTLGASDTIVPTFKGIDAVPAVTYTSADPTVATVDADGNIKAVGLGRTALTVTCDELDTTLTCTVRVTEGGMYDMDENIMLSIFWPPTAEYITDEQYRLMADAGINWVMGAGEGSLANKEAQVKMLELCEKYGIGMTVQDGRFGPALLGKSESVIAGFVKEYKDFAAANGFYILDEPYNPNVYIDAYIALKKAAPNAYMHLNFLPQHAYKSAAEYKAQMDDWCALTAASGYPLDYLMFDNYPFPVSGAMNRNGFFANTRTCWEVGLANDVKTGMYIQTVALAGGFRRPTASEIRYEMYAALAFGYKQLSFFTWFTPINRGAEVFDDGIIAPDGTPNKHYTDIAAINDEILAIGKTLVKCDALEVYFNGSNLYGQPGVPEDFFVKADAADSVILSYLRHKETGRGYLMVVNNDYAKEQEITLTFDAAIRSLSEVSRVDGTLAALTMNGQTLTLTLAAGDAMFIALPEDYDRLDAEEGQPAADVNLAADANINASSSEGASGWFSCNLNDGQRIMGNGNTANGWKTANGKDAHIVIDLGRALDVNRVDLYAAGTYFRYGANFPKAIKLSVSTDGKTYTEIKSFSDFDFSRPQGMTLAFDKQHVRYIRLDLSIKAGDYYMAINEIEVYCDDGTLPAAEQFKLTTEENKVIDYKDGDNIAYRKEPFASSATSEEFKQWGWGLVYITDGRVAVGDKAYAWTSNVGSNHSPVSTEYVGVDFGDIFALEKVVLVPFGVFPADYHIDVSVDGFTWTTISEQKNCDQPSENIVLTLDTPVNARFVRVVGTKLRESGNDGYLFQLGEIEAYGKPVCDKTLLQGALNLYRAESGDESHELYAEAITAMKDTTLTGTQEKDIVTRLLALVNKTVEDVTPAEPVDPDIPVETKPVETEPVDTDPTETEPQETESDGETSEGGADTALETPPEGNETDEGQTSQDKGCGSVIGLFLPVALTVVAACAWIRRREE